MMMKLTVSSIRKMVYEYESGIYVYTGINEKNEDLFVRIKKGIKADIEHVNKNGRSKIRQYDANGYLIAEFLDK